MNAYEAYLINFLDPMVYDIRKRLSKRYPVRDSEGRWYKYQGLCDMSVEILESELRIWNSAYGTNFRLQVIHGEQKHSPRTLSKNWGLQHTWCQVSNGKAKVYVDPTSSQFQDLYKDIPDYYISNEKPKWFYPDRDNISMKGIFAVLNKWRLTYKTRKDGRTIIVREGVVNFIQYEIWGKISDALYKFNVRR